MSTSVSTHSHPLSIASAATAAPITAAPPPAAGIATFVQATAAAGHPDDTTTSTTNNPLDPPVAVNSPTFDTSTDFPQAQHTSVALLADTGNADISMLTLTCKSSSGSREASRKSSRSQSTYSAPGGHRAGGGSRGPAALVHSASPRGGGDGGDASLQNLPVLDASPAMSGVFAASSPREAAPPPNSPPAGTSLVSARSATDLGIIWDQVALSRMMRRRVASPSDPAVAPTLTAQEAAALVGDMPTFSHVHIEAFFGSPDAQDASLDAHGSSVLRLISGVPRPPPPPSLPPPSS